ncbi:adenosylcobinamide-GDP ribazoletransferase [Nonomuraea sp. SBT364]|uniref:adenosylcobinamide-GDP ribazoletransferase n=1 Tax=Nonomuraea sp. SBT364 TaxID=1580530 RepID=UPI00066E6DB0|nr:adenosylcobinamide-GDP ribazoletransferase [Nonomuraea sp. SBT364]
MHGLRFAAGTLSVFPVRVERVDREVAGRAMALAPLVGLALGAVASLPLLLPGPPLLGAALALGLLAALTRGLHLDGLADLADGLGSGKPAPQALDIMKKSDIGPFGVVALAFTLLIQAAALSAAGACAPAGGPALFAAGAPVLVTACVTGRLALTWACRAGVPAARPGGLGVLVAGTVRARTAWLVTLAVLAGAAALGWAAWPARPGPPGGASPTGAPGLIGLPGPAVLVAGAAAGLGAALVMLRHARRRLGGVTGDVLGALVETATAATLVVCAVLG